MNEPEVCPTCGSSKVSRILYGLPLPESLPVKETDQPILGGCEPQDATHGCHMCGSRWDQDAITEPSAEASASIADVFNDYFRNWNIRISPGHVRDGNRDSIEARGWRINYLVDTDADGKLFLEFYATHRMTDDRHVRISSSGDVEDLDAITSMVFFDPNVAGDQERASRKNIEHNRKITAELEAKGLYPSGDINAFLRSGGMEAADTLKEMKKLLAEAGLAMPPIPDELQTQLFRVRRWCYATRDIDPLDMYRFERYLVEALTEKPEPYFAFSHAGHGINSYAITCQIVTKGLSLFVQVPWGGGYMNNKRQQDSIRNMFAKCTELLERLPEEPERQLIVAVSELRSQFSHCGWWLPGQNEGQAREWLRSEKIRTPHPIQKASELLKGRSR